MDGRKLSVKRLFTPLSGKCMGYERKGKEKLGLGRFFCRVTVSNVDCAPESSLSHNGPLSQRQGKLMAIRKANACIPVYFEPLVALTM